MRTITEPNLIAAELVAYQREPSRILGLFVWREARTEDQRTRFAIARVIVNRCLIAPAHGFLPTPAGNILQPDTFDSFRADNAVSRHFPEDDDVVWQQCVLAAKSALGIIHGDPTAGSIFYHGTAHTGPAAEWGRVDQTVTSGRFTFYRIAAA